IEGADDLVAWMSRYMPRDGGNQVRFARGEDKATAAQLVAFLRQSAESFDAVEAVPHEPPLARHFYVHRPLAGGDGKALAVLVARFSPASDEDRELLKAFFLTLVW